MDRVAAIAELFARHQPALRLLAARLCSDPDEAVQRTFLKLADDARAWPDDPVAWAATVCRREALQLARGESRRRRREQRYAGWFVPTDSPGECDDRERVQSALAALPDDEATAATLVVWGGLTFAQVGAVLGVSAATAHRTYHRALDRLRERLAPGDDR